VAVIPAAVIEAFDGLSVLVVGEAMLDCYLRGSTDRLCREAPVPIVAVDERTDVPGGAANTAVNAAALGARVTFLSVAGDDAEGAALTAALRERGVDTEHLLKDGGRRTLAKHRVLAGAQLLVRFDHGTTGRLAPARERELVDRLTALFAAHDAIVVSDYGYGIMPAAMIAALARLQKRHPRVIVVDSKTLGAYRGVGVTAIKPNYAEALGLLGARRPPSGDERAAVIARYGPAILDATGAQVAAVTLDSDGALFFERGCPPHRTYARRAESARAAGAGDTFASALALALAAGADVAAAAEIASAAAAVVVAKDGTAVCPAGELRGYLAGGDKYAPDVAALAPRLAAYRRQGARLVLTSGCFDILHRGHIAYLNAAKALGDVLIVALNTDGGVRRLKGAERPINALDDRAAVLAALSCVDHLVAFDEETPVDVVRAIRPHVFVKGGDYTPAMMPEAPVVEALGGTVTILPYLHDRSTTSVIARIRAADGRALENIA
jgi:D-beta-D-heptose 7-phosphate kinase/D-beta-D-heptose 1-phosphate adenosyltransferase